MIKFENEFNSGCMFAATCAVFVKTFAPYACGSGVPEVKTILSGFIIRGYLGKWTLLIKSLGMVLGSSANLLLGKEVVRIEQVSDCCFFFARVHSFIAVVVVAIFLHVYFQNTVKMKQKNVKFYQQLLLPVYPLLLVHLLVCHFSFLNKNHILFVFANLLLGGVLFSLEEVSYYFPLKTLWRSFFCAMVASLIVKLLSPFENQHLGLFYIGNKYRWFYFEMIPFFILGILGGLFGALFIKLNLAWCKRRKQTWLGRYPVIEVIVIALITLIISYPNPYTRMPMSDLIRRLISPCESDDGSLLCDYQRNSTSAYEKNDIAKPLK